MKNYANNKTRQSFFKGGEMVKSTKLKVAISIVMSILLACLLVPTLSLHAIADNAAQDNNTKQAVAPEEAATTEEAASDKAATDEQTPAKVVEPTQGLSNQEAKSSDSATDNSSTNYDSVDNKYAQNPTNEITVRLEINPAGGGSLNTMYSPKEYTTDFTLDSEDTWTAYDDNMLVSDNTSEYYTATPTVTSEKAYSFVSMFIDDTKVEEGGTFNIVDGTTIKCNFKENETECTATIDFSNEAGDVKVDTSDIPVGWDYEESSATATKNFPQGTSTSDIVAEWKTCLPKMYVEDSDGKIVKVFDTIAPLEESTPIVPSQEKLSDTTTFTVNWVSAVKYTLNLDGGTATNAPSDWTLDTGKYYKYEPIDYGETLLDMEWNNAGAKIIKDGKVFQSYGTTEGQKVTKDKEFTVTYRDLKTFTIKLTLDTNFKDYLTMSKNAGEPTHEDITIDAVENSTWNIISITPETSYVKIIDSTPNETNVALSPVDAAKDLLTPVFSCNGTTAESGTVTSNLTFTGSATYDTNDVTFAFASGSQGKGQIYDYTEFHDEDFVVKAPADYTSYSVNATSDVITLNYDDPFSQSTEYMLIPDKEKGSNNAYWTSDGTTKLEPCEGVKITEDTTFQAYFYEEPVVGGYVYDDVSGDTIEWANLKLVDSAGNILDSCQSTNDPSGLYYMHAPETQNVHVICSKSDSLGAYYDYTSEEFDLTEEAGVVTLDIRLKPAPTSESVTFSGTVVDGITNTPLPNTVIQFTDLEKTTFYSAATDKHGAFSLILPKDTLGYYYVTAPNYSTHEFVLNTGDADITNKVVKVFNVDGENNVSVAVDEEAVESMGQILVDWNGQVQFETSEQQKTEEEYVEKALYSSYVIDENKKKLIITNIYDEVITYTAQRYGACSFNGWTINPEYVTNGTDKPIKQDTDFCATFYENESDLDVNINADSNGFSKMNVAYKNSDGEEYAKDITEPVFEEEQVLYAGSTVIRNEDDSIYSLYTDKGDVEGAEYEEVASVAFGAKEGYSLDKVVLNGEELVTGEPVTLNSDANLNVSFKEVPVDQSNATGSSATSDNMGVIALALAIIALSSAALFALRRKMN